MANYQNNMRYMHRSMPNQAGVSPSCGCTPAASRTRIPAPSCSCKMNGCPDTRDFFPENMPVAMAYVPWQQWRELYEPCKGLQCGTIFAELDKPFTGRGGRRR